MLAWTIYLSLLGSAALVLLPKGNAPAARGVALLTAVLGFVIALAGTLQARSGALQTIAKIPWVPSLGIDYYLAADGISLTLVLLTGISEFAPKNFSAKLRKTLKPSLMVTRLPESSRFPLESHWVRIAYPPLNGHASRRPQRPRPENPKLHLSPWVDL